MQDISAVRDGAMGIPLRRLLRRLGQWWSDRRERNDIKRVAKRLRRSKEPLSLRDVCKATGMEQRRAWDALVAGTKRGLFGVKELAPPSWRYRWTWKD